MQATKETVQKRPHTALWVILCVVLLCAAGAALYFCRWAEKPLTLAEGYVAAEGLTADITDGEGAVLSQPVRGTKVTYVVEDEDKDHPGLVRLVLGEDSFGYLAREHLVTDPKDVVAAKTVYVRTAVNLLDEAGAVPGRLVQKGEALTVTGWQDMDASGAVGRWQVEGGYIRAEYVTMDEPSAKAQYDQEVYQLHAERGDSWGGGDAAGLDYFPREKASFEGGPEPVPRTEPHRRRHRDAGRTLHRGGRGEPEGHLPAGHQQCSCSAAVTEMPSAFINFWISRLVNLAIHLRISSAVILHPLL